VHTEEWPHKTYKVTQVSTLKLAMNTCTDGRIISL